MKVSMEAVILDVQGNPIKRDDKSFILRTVVQDALGAVYADEPNLAGSEKADRFALMMQCNEAEPDLKAESIAKIKMLVGKGFGPVVVGRAYQLLETAA